MPTKDVKKEEKKAEKKSSEEKTPEATSETPKEPTEASPVESPESSSTEAAPIGIIAPDPNAPADTTPPAIPEDSKPTVESPSESSPVVNTPDIAPLSTPDPTPAGQNPLSGATGDPVGTSPTPESSTQNPGDTTPPPSVVSSTTDNVFGPMEEKPKKSKKLWYVIIGLIIILVMCGYAIYDFAGVGKSKSNPAFLPEPTSPAPTVSDDQGDVTPTPAEDDSDNKDDDSTSSVDKATGLDRADLSVTVLNGSGVPGAAKEVADLLEGLGYEIESTGNADTTDYEKTEIRVSSANKKFLDLLKKDLSDDFTIGTTSSTYKDGDAVVIVGAE